MKINWGLHLMQREQIEENKITAMIRQDTRREFLREILYNNIVKIAIQHSKIYFVDTFGDFSHTVE